MLRNVKELIGHSLLADDGPVGELKDFYFDELHWTVRYLVVETGVWLQSRQVLIAPESLRPPGWAERLLPVRLTREQVKNSPPIDTAKPVSRQHETELRAYYGWTPYWGAMYAPSPQVLPVPAPTPEKKEGDPHLRSTNEVIGDRIEASDGDIGHVEDVLIDDETWRLRYLVIDTRNWWPGRKVVISPWWVTEINWPESKVVVGMSRALIKDSPPYDPRQRLDASYADQLHDYYGKPRYIER